jgi:penicillin amidase
MGTVYARRAIDASNPRAPLTPHPPARILSRTMARLKILGSLIGAAALLVVAAGAIFIALTRVPFPKTDGTVELQGIDHPVRISRDGSGVPHVYAETGTDMYFAQGYVHAQDRFWQMEFWRRIGAGRLSEYFGSATLGVDRFMRTMGFTELAQREYARLSGEARTALDAYVAGVNAYISHRKPGQLGLQFRLLQAQGVDVEVERWRPVHSLTWLKVMSYSLGSNLQKEIDRIALAHRVGLEQALSFFPDYRYKEMPTITSVEGLEDHIGPLDALGSERSERKSRETPAGAEMVGQLPDKASRSTGEAPVDWSRGERLLELVPRSSELSHIRDTHELLGLDARGSIGSNAWVVSGSRTAGDAPLLAADLHLGVQMPSIWYEAHLHADTDIDTGSEGFHAAGFTFAGVPGIIIGHNDEIAWGLTNVNPDVQDLYIERIHPNDPNRYRWEGAWRKMITRVERIEIAGEAEPERIIVRETRHGPIISDSAGPQSGQSGFTVTPPAVPQEGLELTELALRWTALEPNRTFDSFYRMNRAESFSAFRDAARLFDIPSQNLVYADRAGNIGYQTPGLIPIRGKSNGVLPVPGWRAEYEWRGYIPFEELPYVLNPDRGYIATANNPVAPREYPHHITAEWDHGYRARRIVDMIEEAGDDITREDIARMQADTLNLNAGELLPYLEPLDLTEVSLGAASVLADRLRAFREMLLQWDHRMERESAGAAAFAFFFQGLVEEAFGDEIPEDLWKRERLLGTITQIQSVLARMVQRPNSTWWDDVLSPHTQETRDDILKRALAQGLRIADRHTDTEMSSWRLGEIHTVTFQSQTFGESEIELVRRIFNRGPIGVPSGLQQVYSADWNLADPFETVHYSSMRQIIDLSAFQRSRMIHPIGQSGHPYHPHYDDMMYRWRDTQYHEHRWSPGFNESGNRDILTLRPTGTAPGE